MNGRVATACGCDYVVARLMPNQTRSSVARLIGQLGAFAGLTLLGIIVAMVAAVVLRLLFPVLSVKFTLPLLSGIVVLLMSWFLTRMFERLPVRAIGIGFDRPWLRQLIMGLLLGGALVAIVWLVFTLCGWGNSQLNPDHSGWLPGS